MQCYDTKTKGRQKRTIKCKKIFHCNISNKSWCHQSSLATLTIANSHVVICDCISIDVSCVSAFAEIEAMASSEVLERDVKVIFLCCYFTPWSGGEVL